MLEKESCCQKVKHISNIGKAFVSSNTCCANNKLLLLRYICKSLQINLCSIMLTNEILGWHNVLHKYSIENYV